MDNLEKILKSFNKKSLSADEREQMRHFLFSFTANERKSEQGRHIKQEQLTWRRFLTGFPRERRRFMNLSISAAVAALVIALTGGTAWAAQNSLPGDTLYPFKVNFNERVAGSVHLSQEARAEWHLNLAERRLAEAQKLAAHGRVDADLLARLEQKFGDNEERVRVMIERLEAAGRHEAAARLSSNLEVMLDTHAKILAHLNEHLTGMEAMAGLTNAVNLRAHAAAQMRAQKEIDARVDMSIAAENRKRAIVNKIEEVKRFLQRMEGRVNAETLAEARANVGFAQSLVAQGDAEIAAGNHMQAFALFQQAHRHVQRSKIIIQAAHTLNIGAEAHVGSDARPLPLPRIELPAQESPHSRPQDRERSHPQNGQTNGTEVFCTQELMICPDGSTVGRIPPVCDFAPCPGQNADSNSSILPLPDIMPLAP